MTGKEVDTKIGPDSDSDDSATTGDKGGVNNLVGDGGMEDAGCSSASRYPNVSRAPVFSTEDGEGMLFCDDDDDADEDVVEDASVEVMM